MYIRESLCHLGEQVHIVYGDGTTTSNADLLGLYGFVDPSAAPADQVREWVSCHIRKVE